MLEVGGFNLSRATELDPKFLEAEYPFEWAGAYNLPGNAHEVVIGHDGDDHSGHEHAHEHPHDGQATRTTTGTRTSSMW